MCWDSVQYGTRTLAVKVELSRVESIVGNDLASEKRGVVVQALGLSAPTRAALDGRIKTC